MKFYFWKRSNKYLGVMQIVYDGFASISRVRERSRLGKTPLLSGEGSAGHRLFKRMTMQKKEGLDGQKNGVRT